MDDFVELETEVFGDDLATGEDGDVFEHLFAAVAEARSLNGAGGHGATQLVDHEGGQSFAFDVFSHDEERLLHLDHFFEQGKDIGDGGDLLVSTMRM